MSGGGVQQLKRGARVEDAPPTRLACTRGLPACRGFWHGWLMHFVRSRLICGAALAAGLACVDFYCCGQALPEAQFATSEPVGQVGTNRYQTPANQVLTPAGVQVELPGQRPQAIALSPNGRLLVTAGSTPELVVIDPATGKVVQRVPLPSGKDPEVTPESVPAEILQPDKLGQLSFTGLAFSPDGTRIYLANVASSVKVFGVKASGQVVGLFSISMAGAILSSVRQGYSGRDCCVAGRQAPLRGAQSLQPVGGVGRYRWPRAPALGRRRGAVRCGAGRPEGLREQLGRTPARTRLGDRPRGPRHVGARGPGPLHCQRGLGVRDRAEPGEEEDRRPKTKGRSAYRVARVGDCGVAEWSVGRGGQRGE